MEVQSLPLAEYAVRGTTQPPPAIIIKRRIVSKIKVLTGAYKSETKNKLTAFEIARGVDALPCARVVAVDAAC